MFFITFCYVETELNCFVIKKKNYVILTQSLKLSNSIPGSNIYYIYLYYLNINKKNEKQMKLIINYRNENWKIVFFISFFFYVSDPSYVVSNLTEL